jgi:uncharacterized membrane protein
MTALEDTPARLSQRALLAAGVFGFGFSGLVDVVVLHHVLQWHHLLSGIYPMDTLAGLRTNILADGVFSLGMLVVMSVGAGLLWQAERRSSAPLALRPLAGTALIGLGVFDVFDAVVDHMLLGLHQPLSQGGRYNPHWLVVSLLFVAAGYYVYRTGLAQKTGDV